MNNDRRNDWMIIGAVALIVVGGWIFLGRAFGPWLEPVRQAMAFAERMALPLTLIALGVLLFMVGQRGALGGGVQGRRLYRSRSDRMIGGVLGGLGTYLGIDPTWLRVAYVIFGFTTWGLSLLIYIVAMVVVPEEPAGASAAAAPNWPSTGAPTVSSPSKPSSGWPHATGHETVQTPPAPPAAPESPAAPDADSKA